MAAVEITISGMLYDKLARTTQNVVLIGEATLTGLGVGGGPIIPPDKPPGGGGPPPGIWPNPPEGQAPIPSHPIVLPGDPGWGPPQLPPEVSPPQPGDPTKPVPGNWPVQPITPPPYIVVNYPGIGPVVVSPPASSS